MKKIALGIALVMLLTMVFGVFASAVDVADGEAAMALDLFGSSQQDDGSIKYTGKTEGVPTDLFGVALRLTTGNVGFCAYEVTLSWDPELIEFYGFMNGIDGDPLQIYNPTAEVLNVEPVVNQNNVKDGQLNMSSYSTKNFQKTSGFSKVDIYDIVGFYCYFKPLTDKPCNAIITLSGANVIHTDAANNYANTNLTTTTTNLTIKLNGGAVERTEPLESLGAQVNEEKKGIRFGANFYNLKDKAAVEELGMLVVSDYRLKGGDLKLDLVNEYVVKVQARGILNYVEGLTLENYDKVTFVATVTGIPDEHLGDAIVARPYVVYSEGDPVYSAAMSRNYNGVHEAADGKFE